MNNISYTHIDDLIPSKLKSSAQIINKQPDASPNQNDFSKASANTDTFENSSNGSDINSIGLYTKSVNTQRDIISSEVMAVQNVSSTNSTSNYYDVIKNKAAQKAGATVSSNGSINIPGPSAAYAYQAERKMIEGTFWCQTGGWSNLEGNGSRECCRTAVATMASINSGTIVTPDDTGSSASSVTVNDTRYQYKDGGVHTI